MNRPRYKELYLSEKSSKEVYKNTLDNILETLKTFDDVTVYDKTYATYPIIKRRHIEIRQNNKYLQVALNLDALGE